MKEQELRERGKWTEMSQTDILGTGNDIMNHEDFGKLRIIHQTEPGGRRLGKLEGKKEGTNNYIPTYL